MAKAARTRIDFFYDIISPYSWVGFETLTRYAAVWNIDLKLRPFFLGGIMKEAENRPPMTVPNKMQYMQKDLHRLVHHFGVPLRPMADPFDSMLNKGSLNCQRFLVSVHRKKPDLLEEASRQMWIRRWNQDKSINSVDDFLEITKKLNLPNDVANDIIAKVEHADTKAELKKNTQEALEHGAFGAPWIHIYKDGKIEPFWGSDRIHVIAEMIGEQYNGPLKERSKCKL